MITRALVDKCRLNSISVNAADKATCSGGRARLGFCSGIPNQLNGSGVGYGASAFDRSVSVGWRLEPEAGQGAITVRGPTADLGDP